MLAVSCAAFMMAQLVSGKATRDALFLHAFGAQALPVAMVSAAVMAFVFVEVTGQTMLRFTPARVVPLAFVTSACLFALEWSLSESFPRIAAAMVYLHVVGLSPVLSSCFWSVVSERFDPHTARKYVGQITAGGSVGGIVGGLCAWRLSSALSLPAVLLLLGVLNLLSAWCLMRFGASSPADKPNDIFPHPRVSGLQVLRNVPYLRHLAAFVMLGAAAQALLDYALSANAAAVFAQDGSLMTFFSIFYVGTGALGLAGQTAFGRLSLQKLGLAGTVATLPLTVMFGGVGAAFSNNITGALVVRGAELVVRSSVYRAGYELFYTPLPPEKKRPTKALIDVGADRIGTALGSGLTMLTLLAFHDHAPQAAIVTASLVALAAALLAPRLGDGYISSLAESLRSGAVQLREQDAQDNTTLRTLSLTSVAINRESILQEIARIQSGRGALARLSAPSQPNNAPSSAWSQPNSPPPNDAFSTAAPSALLRCIADLESRVTRRAQTWLRAGDELDQRCAVHVVPLLGVPALAKDAVLALRSIAPRITGLLFDTLMDDQASLDVRMQIPRVLKVSATQRTADGLVACLSDSCFDIRFTCARALFSITRPPTSIIVPRARIFEIVADECDATKDEALGRPMQPSLHDEDVTTASADELFGGTRDRRVQHIFTLLGVVLDREALSLAFKALRTRDDHVHGTALEYLDNVVPKPIAASLLPLLQVTTRHTHSTRNNRELLDDLLRSQASIEIASGLPGDTSDKPES